MPKHGSEPQHNAVSTEMQQSCLTLLTQLVQADMQIAALASAGRLGIDKAGADTLLMDETHIIQEIAGRAVGHATQDVKVAALHALANIAGRHPAYRHLRSVLELPAQLTKCCWAPVGAAHMGVQHAAGSC